MRGPFLLVVHRSQKNVFKRIAPLIHAPDLDTLVCGNDIKIARFYMVGNHKLDAPARECCTLAAQAPDAH
jgi:hypothetical protein